MQYEFEMRGHEQVMQGFNNLSSEFKSKVLYTVIEWGIHRIWNFAKTKRFIRTGRATAPVPGILTSRSSGSGLRAGILATMKRMADGAIGAVGVPTTHTASAYARIHEYGGNAGRGHASRIPPRPYLKPALEGEKENINREFTHQIWRAIRRANLQ